MSQNIHAYLIVMIIGKTSIPETGIATECWLPNLVNTSNMLNDPPLKDRRLWLVPPLFLLKSSDPSPNPTTPPPLPGDK